MNISAVDKNRVGSFLRPSLPLSVPHLFVSLSLFVSFLSLSLPSYFCLYSIKSSLFKSLSLNLYIPPPFFSLSSYLFYLFLYLSVCISLSLLFVTFSFCLFSSLTPLTHSLRHTQTHIHTYTHTHSVSLSLPHTF